MSRICVLCNKGSIMMGTRMLLRGKYNPTKRSRKYPNLQWATLSVSAHIRKRFGGASRIKICTKCLKGKKHLKIKKR